MNNVVNQSPYLKTSREFPEEVDELVVEINKSYVDVAAAVNNRTIGIFPTRKSAVTGESWFLTTQRQQTFRQIYNFGPIGVGAELDILTGITGFTQFTRIYGTVVTVGNSWRPLPYIDNITLTAGITLLVDLDGMGRNQIRIVNGAAAPSITQGLVVLEWLAAV